MMIILLILVVNVVLNVKNIGKKWHIKMTERQKFNIAAIKQSILEADGYRCTYPGCSKPAVNLAHGISQSKINIRVYGRDIVHHPYNMFSVCSNPEHNDFFSINHDQYKIDKLIVLIKHIGGLTSKDIRMFLNNELDYREVNERIDK